MDEVELPESEETLTDRLAVTADNLDALLGLVIGYKNKAVEAGFSEYAAEEMAVQVHQHLLEN